MGGPSERRLPPRALQEVRPAPLFLFLFFLTWSRLKSVRKSFGVAQICWTFVLQLLFITLFLPRSSESREKLQIILHRNDNQTFIWMASGDFRAWLITSLGLCLPPAVLCALVININYLGVVYAGRTTGNQFTPRSRKKDMKEISKRGGECELLQLAFLSSFTAPFLFTSAVLHRENRGSGSCETCSAAKTNLNEWEMKREERPSLFTCQISSSESRATTQKQAVDNLPVISDTVQMFWNVNLSILQ